MMKPSVYRVDLREIDGEGDFPCPKCGILISPDDEGETVYSIHEVKMKGNYLDELVLQCNKCGSIIYLIGFNSIRTSEIDH